MLNFLFFKGIAMAKEQGSLHNNRYVYFEIGDAGIGHKEAVFKGLEFTGSSQ